MQTIQEQPTRTAEKGSEEAKPAAQPKSEHTRGLLLVGLFKLSKAIFFGALGAGALHLVHRDVGDMLMRFINVLPIDPESHIVGIVMDKADLIGGHQLREAGKYAFLYAGLCLIEGTGLVMEKAWAEYFTVVLTLLGLPWETYELFVRFSTFKVGLLLVNLVVLAYLLWVLKRKREKR